MDKAYRDRMERPRPVRWPVVVTEPEPLRCPSCGTANPRCVRTVRASEHVVIRERVCAECGVLVKTTATE